MEPEKFTPAQQQQFIDAADFDLSIETWESFQNSDDCTFELFFKSYQEKHKAKYGAELTINIE